MKTAKLSALRFVIFSYFALIALSAYPDGIIIPPPEVQMAIKYHKVSVSIDNQMATTKVDQVFINQSDREIEGTYVFPLPPGVAMSNKSEISNSFSGCKKWSSRL